MTGQRTLGDAYHPWTPPASLESWEAEAARIRRQLQVACGLWPMPERQALEPQVHGLVDRGDYTVERVYFASRPGLYVTGSLYRPKSPSGKKPGVLCPHGHWQDGRFYDAGAAAAGGEFQSGAESYLSGARSPLQARMVQLARMGCIVFHYDMIGVADNHPLPHREGFNDVAAELWLQNKLGLQTWNSIRALDFLCSLPDVDTDRIGVTGASGGGTQTFMLCALDPRPAIAFPAVMVSTAMQGGCQCENASYLRLGINNVAIAALMAPRPMMMSGAHDWTIDIETKGLPELKAIYALYGRPELVQAECHPEFGHNYNQVSREIMYRWFKEHMPLDPEAPASQTDFWPLTTDELTVFDDQHPRPDDAWTADRLRAEMTGEEQSAFAALIPRTADDVARYRDVVGGAASVMLSAGLPAADAVHVSSPAQQTLPELVRREFRCGLSGQDLPVLAFAPARGANGEFIVWIDGGGRSVLTGKDGQPTAIVQALVRAGYSVASTDVFLTGSFLKADPPPTYPVDAGFPGYTFCYNAPLVSQRVQDILTLTAAIRKSSGVQTVHVVGTGEAGLWALLARAVAGDSLGRTVVDLQQFRFENVKQSADPNLLPGALKYGDVDGLAALAAPGPVKIFGAAGAWPACQAVARTMNAKFDIVESPLDEQAIRQAFMQ